MSTRKRGSTKPELTLTGAALSHAAQGTASSAPAIKPKPNIPVENAVTPTPKITPHFQPDAATGRLLLIADDEPSVLTTLRMVFEEEGYVVNTAPSCGDALKLFQQGYIPDALITDLNMEREDIGLELARAAIALTPRPIVVICTGFAGLMNAEAALEMKVDYMATKPTDLNELTAALDSLLRRRGKSPATTALGAAQ